MTIESLSSTRTCNLSSSLKRPGSPFHLPRIKVAASSLLRHGHHSSPSYHISELQQQNSFRPACQLPGAILSKIFIICAHTNVGLYERGWSWVCISYVCSNWRKVALSCPQLWRFVDFSDPKWFAITLGRAKTQPLHICTTVGRHNIQQLHRTLQLAHQIRTINLKSSLHHIHSLLQILAHPNPALESLTINVDTAGHGISEKVYEPVSFPTTGPSLQNLRYLELHSVPFYLISPRFKALTHLHLYGLTPCERPTHHDFLSTLEHFPLLQYLTLDHAFPSNTTSDATSTQILDRRISLPHLTSLRMIGSISELTNILDSAMFPPNVRLACIINTLSDWDSNIWKLSQALSVHSWAAAEAFPLETLVISAREEPVYTTMSPNNLKFNSNFCYGLRVRGFTDNDNCTEAALDLVIGPDPLHSTDEVMVKTLSAVWKGLSLTRVHTLVLQDLDIATQNSWSGFLKTLPSLCVVNFTGHAPSGFVWALLLNTIGCLQRLTDRPDAHRLLAPRLTDIYLHGVDCSRGGYMVAPGAPVNSMCDLDDSRFLDVLTVCLRNRARLNLGLRSISIARCKFVSRKVVEELREAAAHCIWDQMGIIKEETSETMVAKYRKEWDKTGTQPIRHYYRLNTLLDTYMD